MKPRLLVVETKNLVSRSSKKQITLLNITVLYKLNWNKCETSRNDIGLELLEKMERCVESLLPLDLLEEMEMDTTNRFLPLY